MADGRSEWEKYVLYEYRRQGWHTITSGWPDALMWKVDEDGNLHTQAVEIKAKRDKLHGLQPVVLFLLHLMGVKTKVAYAGPGWGKTLGQEPDLFHESVVCEDSFVDQESKGNNVISMLRHLIFEEKKQNHKMIRISRREFDGLGIS